MLTRHVASEASSNSYPLHASASSSLNTPDARAYDLDGFWPDYQQSGVSLRKQLRNRATALATVNACLVIVVYVILVKEKSVDR